MQKSRRNIPRFLTYSASLPLSCGTLGCLNAILSSSPSPSALRLPPLPVGEARGFCKSNFHIAAPLAPPLGGYLLRFTADADTNDLPLEITDTKVSFPWFPAIPTPEEPKAYDTFICKLCELAQTQKRVTATEKPADNEKYAFRCFLLRLGFIGAEYKEARKILLRNLAGSSAFKGGQAKSANNLKYHKPKVFLHVNHPINSDEDYIALPHHHNRHQIHNHY